MQLIGHLIFNSSLFDQHTHTKQSRLSTGQSGDLILATNITSSPLVNSMHIVWHAMNVLVPVIHCYLPHRYPPKWLSHYISDV